VSCELWVVVSGLKSQETDSQESVVVKSETGAPRKNDVDQTGTD
jgi:hypothetical protein